MSWATCRRYSASHAIREDNRTKVFNAMGLLFLLPAMALIIYAVFATVASFPHGINVPWNLSEAGHQ